MPCLALLGLSVFLGFSQAHLCLSSLHTCKGRKRWGLSATRASATRLLPGSKVGGAAERLSLRSPAPAPAPALERAGGRKRAGWLHRVLERRESLRLGRRVLPRPPACPASRSSSAPGFGGGGREGPRASDSSSPTPFSRALQVSGLCTWALWEGAR